MSEGLKKACFLLSFLKEDEAREVIKYLTEEEKIKIKEGANFLSDEKTDFVLSLVEEKYV